MNFNKLPSFKAKNWMVCGLSGTTLKESLSSLLSNGTNIDQPHTLEDLFLRRFSKHIKSGSEFFQNIASIKIRFSSLFFIIYIVSYIYTGSEKAGFPDSRVQSVYK